MLIGCLFSFLKTFQRRTATIITKFLLVIIASAAGTFGGMYLSRRLKTRAGYYAALGAFINHISSEVKFRKNPIKIIVADFLADNETPLSKNLSEYADAPDPISAVLSRGVLKKTESAEVQKFLSSLGYLDSDTQVCELQLYKEKFAALSSDASEKSKKYAAMYVKLGFFLGLALGIVVL